ncbi:MAG: hypothetical protein Q4E62_03240 [Sutterellaceae bacterium]|nr:hypothetical protein [Sutterellaceae bacterium]
MKTSTSRISQAIDALKLSLDDTEDAQSSRPLTPTETISQLAREIKALQTKKAELLAEIQALEAHKFELSGSVTAQPLKKTVKKAPQKPVAQSGDKTLKVDPTEAMNKLKAAFDGF